MKVTSLLCDAAQVAEGKLYIIGAGWTHTGPGPVTMAVASLIEVPWDRTNQQLTFTLELHTADGRLVMQNGPLGEVPVKIEAVFEVGRPPGLAPGSSIPVPFAVPVQGLQLNPGERFSWEISVADETREDWSLHFATRPLAPAPGGPADPTLPTL